MSNELESRYEQIDEHAKREKIAIKFVFDLIDQNQEEFNEVFSGSDGNIPNESEMYDKVEQTIKTMQMEALRTYGVVISYLKTNDDRQYLEPTVKLGWRKYYPAFSNFSEEDPQKEYPNVLRLTELGEEVVDGWRSAHGYVSLQNQRQINYDREEARRNSSYGG